jgi:hypothetical protein
MYIPFSGVELRRRPVRSKIVEYGFRKYKEAIIDGVSVN